MTNFLVQLLQQGLLREAVDSQKGGAGPNDEGPPPPLDLELRGLDHLRLPGASTTIEAPPARSLRNYDRIGGRAAYPTLPR